MNMENDTLENSGKASFYHDNFQGQETSNGDIYDQNDFTAAHRTLPFGTKVFGMPMGIQSLPAMIIESAPTQE